jgi:hypothetical protein
MITTNSDQDKHLFEEYILVSFVACIIISMAELKFLSRVRNVSVMLFQPSLAIPQNRT